jgi:thymidylate synthase ThyX
MLAAVAARYSRNNQGLEDIIAKIPKDNPDKAIDSIFNMVDYGHQSIADMAILPFRLDGISLYAAYILWSMAPRGSGQESSTRYLNFSTTTQLKQEPEGFQEFNAQAFKIYAKAIHFWKELEKEAPERIRLPAALAAAKKQGNLDAKTQRTIDRITRNFVFDRSRYFLPYGCSTNMFLILSARDWTEICQNLRSHPLPELKDIGSEIFKVLKTASPRMTRHANATDYCTKFIENELAMQRKAAIAQDDIPQGEQCLTPIEDGAFLRIQENMVCAGMDEALKYHPHRYAPIGSKISLLGVNFGWEKIAFAELRDLNRHRTGTKYTNFVPNGFYFAQEEIARYSDILEKRPDLATIARELGEYGARVTQTQLEFARDGDINAIYLSLLGTTYSFQHTTTGNKFIYEMELRTGTGAHFRYAEHCRNILKLWYQKFPETKGLICEGEAEPE